MGLTLRATVAKSMTVVEWLKMVWVEFGCRGHGKCPWDGLGVMAKSKVTVDIMHGKERTSTGKITSSMV